MFTGIIETIGELVKIENEGTNTHFSISSKLAPELKIDQSLAHNGVCLTVVQINGAVHIVTAIEETLNKTNLSDLQLGDSVNLERCMQMNGRLDGHIVQGHVDTTGICTKVENRNGSWNYHFQHSTELSEYVTVTKGSICINGVSLTVVNSGEGDFSVSIIPYTYEHTQFKHLQEGMKVNLEFDILGKYVAKLMNR
jgi:riboflavin synthase